MQNALNPSWWHSENMTPLEAVRVTAQCLDDGEAVPAPAARHISRALRQYLAGQLDITKNLGLRPRRGGTHETPLRLESAADRNACIQAIFDAMPGTSQRARAEQTAAILRTPPDRRINEADVFKHLSQLYEKHAETLPKSTRQVIRIVNGETVAERRKIAP